MYIYTPSPMGHLHHIDHVPAKMPFALQRPGAKAKTIGAGSVSNWASGMCGDPPMVIYQDLE